MQVEHIALWLKETAEFFGEPLWELHLDEVGYTLAIGTWSMYQGFGLTIEDAAWDLVQPLFQETSNA